MGKGKQNCLFPASRIKKIIQSDEEVGKVATGTPIAVSKATEQFMLDLITAASQHAKTRKQNKVTASHLKAAIQADPTFDFLKDAVASIPDLIAYDPDLEDEEGDVNSAPKKPRKPRKDKGIPKGKKPPKDATGAGAEGTGPDAQMDFSPPVLTNAPQIITTSKLDADDENYDDE